jgi:hypothetical protein
MTAPMFVLRPDGRLEEMRGQDYLTEAHLQELLATYPALLAGELMNPGEPPRWILIRREAGIADSPDSGGRWEVDHLFVDHSAIPTFVEVKRSSDTRIRREVVGQMLDYASNAVVHMTVEQMRAWFESLHREEDPDEVLREVLGPDADTEDFWLRVKTNLQAGRIRLLFVADRIPSELRRIVEFLNTQMDPAEVLAVEVAQYVGGDLKTLVPSLIGQSERTRAAKTSAGRSPRGDWSPEQSMEELATTSAVLEEVGRAVLEWGATVDGLSWGNAHRVPELIPTVAFEGRPIALFTVSVESRVYLAVHDWRRHPILSTVEEQQEILERVADAVGVRTSRPRNAWPWFPADALADPEARARYFAVMTELAERLRDAAGRSEA